MLLPSRKIKLQSCDFDTNDIFVKSEFNVKPRLTLPASKGCNSGSEVEAPFYLGVQYP